MKTKKYFHLWPLQLLCGSFWRCHIFGDFWRWDIFGGEIFSEHLATHAKAWHVSAACLAPAQLKGGCLLPEGSACDEYLLNLLTYPPPLDHTLPTMGGGDPSSMGISCPTSNFPISPPQGERGQLARICSNHQRRSKHLPEIKTLPKWNCSQFYEMDLFCQLRNCSMRCFEILNWDVYLEHRGLNRMKNILPE